MYTSFTIENFRCFRKLAIEPLERVNLIAGKNNVGKTALLEALWLHQGPDLPDLGLRLNSFRGLPPLDPREFYWDLFNNFDRNQRIMISARGDWGAGSRALHIYLRERQTTQVTLSHATGGSATGRERSTAFIGESQEEVVLEYTNELGQPFTSRGWLTQEQVSPVVIQEGMRMDKQNIPGRPVSVYLPPRLRLAPQEEADRFASFQITGTEHDLIDVLKHTEPRLCRVVTVATLGTPVIYGDIGLGRLMPIPLMGEGMGRLLNLALSFAVATNGLVLVDEIENGLHHSIMVKVWKSLAFFARKFNVQLFATTHSEECIRSAHQAFDADEHYDFRLHRLDRIGEEIRAVEYDRETLATALEGGLEVR